MELFTELKVLGLRFLIARAGVKFSEEDLKEFKDVKNLLSNLSDGVNKVADSLSVKKIKIQLAEIYKVAKDNTIFFGLTVAVILVALIILNSLSQKSDLLFVVIKTLDVLFYITSFSLLISLIVFRALKRFR